MPQLPASFPASTTIALIGGGHMGRGLIGGWLVHGIPANRIVVGEAQAAARTQLAHEFQVAVTADNAQAVRAADIVVLAVKPQGLAQVAQALAPALAERRPLVLSVAAGIRSADLARWCGARIPIVRAMPNRPALVGAGATGLYAVPQVDAAQRLLAETLMRASGAVVWVESEMQLDVVTALSGSGPAYFFLLAELMAATAERMGLPAAAAQTLAAQTLYGAGRLAGAPAADLAQLRAQVTSPGGTTAAALASLQDARLAQIVDLAMAAAAQRSRELAEQFGAAPAAATQ